MLDAGGVCAGSLSVSEGQPGEPPPPCRMQPGLTQNTECSLGSSPASRGIAAPRPWQFSMRGQLQPSLAASRLPGLGTPPQCRHLPDTVRTLQRGQLNSVTTLSTPIVMIRDTTVSVTGAKQRYGYAPPSAMPL